MKKTLSLLIFIFSFSVFSQNLYTFKRGGKIIQNEVKVNPNEIRNLLSSNDEALKLYEEGRSKKTIGNIFLIAGFGTILGKFIYEVTEPMKTRVVGYNYFGSPIIVDESSNSNTLFYVGAGLVILAIPIKLGFSNKIRKTVDLMNNDLKNSQSGFNIESTSIISNSNGVGISITF